MSRVKRHTGKKTANTGLGTELYGRKCWPSAEVKLNPSLKTIAFHGSLYLYEAA